MSFRAQREISYYVYIMTNNYHTVFYTGFTNNLNRRLYEHQHKLVNSFTSKYKITKLLYFEEYSNVYEAIAREKQIKDYRRAKKLTLVRSINPDLGDLSLRSR